MLREIRKNPQITREEEKALALQNKSCCTSESVQCLHDNIPCSETVRSGQGYCWGLTTILYMLLKIVHFSAQDNK